MKKICILILFLSFAALDIARKLPEKKENFIDKNLKNEWR
tara:strand:- start:8 stop:127 length:120 start_codon:yes stop_codon:yes gene_type:complete